MLTAVSPALALWLVLAGVLLLYAEFNRPGTILLGAAGMLLAMLGVGALTRWPLSSGCGGLVLTGLGLLSGDLLLRTRGVLAIGSVLALARGLHGLVPGGRVGWGTAAAVAVLFVSVSWVLGRIALAARANKRIGGRQGAA